MAWWSAIVLEVSTDVQKVEKEMASLTEEGTEVSTESVQASADTVGPIWSQLQE